MYLFVNTTVQKKQPQTRFGNVLGMPVSGSALQPYLQLETYGQAPHFTVADYFQTLADTLEEGPEQDPHLFEQPEDAYRDLLVDLRREMQGRQRVLEELQQEQKLSHFLVVMLSAVTDADKQPLKQFMSQALETPDILKALGARGRHALRSVIDMFRANDMLFPDDVPGYHKVLSA
ncbi:MAG: hypothetical protein SFZ03_01440 [Candidatus Melainabacteria bacterium]|nr:hypothetical protein [Candidatus Melainabacteria bacterium]